MKPDQTPEQDILTALRALAESDRGQEAPAAVEVRLRQAFRRKHAPRAWKLTWAVAAAAAVMGIVVLYTWRPRPQPVGIAETLRPAAQPVPEPTDVSPVMAKPARRIRAARPPRPRESVTEFFPLMDPAPPFERGEMVRVNLPASAMRAAGLPVREDRLEDRIQADVLVSEEGVPTAIRFVKYSQ